MGSGKIGEALNGANPAFTTGSAMAFLTRSRQGRRRPQKGCSHAFGLIDVLRGWTPIHWPQKTRNDTKRDPFTYLQNFKTDDLAAKMRRSSKIQPAESDFENRLRVAHETH
jgi:hypothetical protein